MDKKAAFLVCVSLAALAGCAGDVASLATPSAFSGGFRFKQYVTVSPGDREVLGDEGVFYVSWDAFTDEQLTHIRQYADWKAAMDAGTSSSLGRPFDVYLSSAPRASGKAADAVGYLSFVMTRVYDAGGVTGLRLHSWPDFWYDWHIAPSNTGYTVYDVGTDHAFGWSASRVVIARDPAVTLDTCLHYRDSVPASAS